MYDEDDEVEAQVGSSGVIAMKVLVGPMTQLELDDLKKIYKWW